MQYHYETRGVCSRAIDINLDEATGIIRNVQFTGGCNGNTKGLPPSPGAAGAACGP